MSNYTPEQVEQAKQEGQLLVDIYNGSGGQIFFCTNDGKKHDIGAIVKTILAALEAAQVESIHQMGLSTKCATERNEALDRAEKLSAYVSKLEKAGDGIRNYKPDSNPLQAETDIEELFDAWDAARKAKP